MHACVAAVDRQGRSGLGLEAQREAVMRHVAAIGGRLLEKFTEVESGRRSDRSRLVAALACGALLAATPMAPEPGACSGVHRPPAA